MLERRRIGEEKPYEEYVHFYTSFAHNFRYLGKFFYFWKTLFVFNCSIYGPDMRKNANAQSQD